jgi:hypothetical protein
MSGIAVGVDSLKRALRYVKKFCKHVKPSLLYSEVMRYIILTWFSPTAEIHPEK